jgi:N6-L-threonylcarbamoyladenine synthase
VADARDAARLARRRAERLADLILALETSCDDTCAAVVGHAGEVLSSIVSSQGVHDRFGGVVPEIASRHHLELVNAVVDDALRQAGVTFDDVSLVAVTQGPGLVGALLVGVATAKGLAAARRLPLAPVDHLQGHVAANFLAPEPIEPPFLCLIASGGHTLLVRVTDHRGYDVIGRTLDDAAGEAFDKGARLLGLGYPGGPALSRLALDGDPGAFDFPTAARVAGLDFSFAGLKTALLYAVRDLGEEEARRRAADLAASYEHAIVEALVARIERALAAEPGARLAIGGGVAANRLLRRRAEGLGVDVKVPPPELCTDNAAMIASAARWVEPLPYPAYLDLDAYATGRRSRAA